MLSVKTSRKKTFKKLTVNSSTYILGKTIGKGQYGQVLAFPLNILLISAMDEVTGLIVAIKHMPHPSNSVPDLHEINILEKLNHENIISFIDYRINPREIWILMEYMDCGSLLSILQNYGPLQLSLVKKHSLSIIHGLIYLHSNGIIHQDLKCANVLVNSKGRTVLSDFGVSRWVNGDESSFVGSAYWLAPEIIRFEKPSTLSDIWSLGCTIYEMFLGTPPFYGKDPIHLFYLLSTSNIKPDLPDDLQPFLDLCFKYQERPSADELSTHEWFNPQIQIQSPSSQYDESTKEFNNTKPDFKLENGNKTPSRSNLFNNYSPNTSSNSRTSFEQSITQANHYIKEIESQFTKLQLSTSDHKSRINSTTPVQNNQDINRTLPTRRVQTDIGLMLRHSLDVSLNEISKTQLKKKPNRCIVS